MIDLEWPRLPTVLLVGGEEVPIETSFRAWLRWGRLMEAGYCSPHVLKAAAHGDWVPAAVEFYRSENPTPRGRGDERVIDLALDGDYVVGSFQAAYGIDLTEGDMHWHRFLALLRSLPSDSKLAEVAGYRAWRRTRSSQESVMRRLRDEWALPPKEAHVRISPAADEFLDANEARLRERLRARGGAE